MHSKARVSIHPRESRKACLHRNVSLRLAFFSLRMIFLLVIQPIHTHEFPPKAADVYRHCSRHSPAGPAVPYNTHVGLYRPLSMPVYVHATRSQTPLYS